MTAYYNEIDPYAAAWLRNLIEAGEIAPGIVDERSIEDVYPSDLRGFAQCHFFAGLGGWSLALRWAGWADSRPIWTGSCPCQPFSAAGKGAGFADERHLWPAFFHLIAQCGPAKVVGEQVASSAAWLDLVRGDLEAVGYAMGQCLSKPRALAPRIDVTGSGGLLPTPSGTSNHGKNHVAGRIDEWGGSSNYFRGTPDGNKHLPGFELWTMGYPDAWRRLMPPATPSSRRPGRPSSKP